MRSIPQALLWEFSRHGWWRLVMALSAALGVSAIVYSSLLREGPLDPRAGRVVHVVLSFVTFVICGGAALSAQGEPRRLYLLPLSNWYVSAVALLPGLFSAAVLYAVSAAVLNAGWGAGWPVWGPAVFLAAMMGGMQAAAHWVGSNRLGRFAAWCLVAVPSAEWLRMRYGGDGYLSPRAMWTTVTFGEWWTLTAMLGLAFVVFVQAVARDRRGEAGLGACVPRGWAISRGNRGRDLPRFRSASAAQFWSEWRRKGTILPATFAVFALFVVAEYVLNRFDNGEYELLHCCIGYGAGLGVIGIGAGLTLGHIEFPQSNLECGSFLATRPMSNAELSRVVLTAHGASLALTWGLWTVCFFATSAILYFDQGSHPVLDLWTDHFLFAHALAVLGPWYPLLLVAAGLIVAWIPLSLTTVLVLTGRRRWVLAAVAGGIPALLVGLFLAALRAEGHIVLPDDVWRWLVGGSAGLATAASFGLAWRQRLIGAATFGMAFSGWAALCVVVGLVMGLVGGLQTAMLVSTAGLLALPFAPLAAGPLALSWNRHR
jgi:hypothetical protein